jgi:hypothetical protein
MTIFSSFKIEFWIMLLEMFIFKIHYCRYHQFLRQFCTVVLHFSYNLSILTITSLGHRIFAKSACLLVVELEANFLVSDFSIFPGGGDRGYMGNFFSLRCQFFK